MLCTLEIPGCSLVCNTDYNNYVSFVSLLSTSRQLLDDYLKLRFLLHCFQSINRQPSMLNKQIY